MRCLSPVYYSSVWYIVARWSLFGRKPTMAGSKSPTTFFLLNWVNQAQKKYSRKIVKFAGIDQISQYVWSGPKELNWKSPRSYSRSTVDAGFTLFVCEDNVTTHCASMYGLCALLPSLYRHTIGVSHVNQCTSFPVRIQGCKMTYYDEWTLNSLISAYLQIHRFYQSGASETRSAGHSGTE